MSQGLQSQPSGGEAGTSRRGEEEAAGPSTGGMRQDLPEPSGSRGAGPSQPPPPPATGGRPEALRSLYVGKLHPSVNEVMLLEIFSTLGAVQEVKVIRDKLTSLSAGYGFVTYYDPRCAALALQSIDRRVLYGQEVLVNWASQRDTRPDTSNHFHIFIGDLAAEVDDQTLIAAVHPLGGCSDARVVWDLSTGRSKGYGFASFYTKGDAENAMVSLSGATIGSRAVRCGWAHHKKDAMQSIDYVTVDQADPLNANVYIGSISPEVKAEELQGYLEQFGPLLDFRIFRKNCYGFAQYQHHDDAVVAIVGLNGLQMGGKVLRLSWGRHQARAAAAATAAMTPTPMMTAAAAAAAYGLQQLPGGMVVACQAPGGMMYPYQQAGGRMMMPTQLQALQMGGLASYGQQPQMPYGSPQASPQAPRQLGPGGYPQQAQQQSYGMLLMQQQAAQAQRQQPMQQGLGGRRLRAGSFGGSPADVASLGAGLAGMQLGQQQGGAGGYGSPVMMPPMPQPDSGALDPSMYGTGGYRGGAAQQWPQQEGGQQWPEAEGGGGGGGRP